MIGTTIEVSVDAEMKAGYPTFTMGDLREFIHATNDFPDDTTVRCVRSSQRLVARAPAECIPMEGLDDD